jgi:KDO2-lipid IV(A) lauroyltransferase
MIKRELSRAGTVLLYLMSLLPFWLLYVIADIVFVCLYHVLGYRKKVVAENLRNSFPEKSAAERYIIEQKYYRYLADLMVETIKCTTMTEKEIRRRMYPTNPEMLEYYFNEGKSVIMTTAHYGNWELAALRLGMVTAKPKLIIYKPLSNKLFNDFINRNRSRFGATMVSMKQTVRKVAECKKDLCCVLLVADQSPAVNEAHHFTSFLNQQTAVFMGPEKLTRFINGAMVFCKIELVKRGYYTATLVPLVDNPKEAKPFEITDKHVQCLESIIREKPECWLWSHRRWKIKPELIDAGKVVEEYSMLEKAG